MPSHLFLLPSSLLQMSHIYHPQVEDSLPSTLGNIAPCVSAHVKTAFLVTTANVGCITKEKWV